MKYRSYLNLVLALAIFGGVLTFSNSSGKISMASALLDPSINQMSLVSSSSGQTEEGSIDFEILVPEVKWIIPKNEPGLESPVQIGFQITNNQQASILLGRIDPSTALSLNIEDSKGEMLNSQGARDRIVITPKTHSTQIHCSLLTPGQSLTFFLDAKLYWHDSKLILGGLDGLGGIWYFKDIKPGSYKVNFSFINERSVGYCPESGKKSPIEEGLWTGAIRTPSVEVQIIKPLI